LCNSPTTYTEGTGSGAPDIDPVAILAGNNATNSLIPNTDFTTTTLQNGLTVGAMYYNGSVGNSITAAAFLANPGSLGVGNLPNTQAGAEGLGIFVITSGPAFSAAGTATRDLADAIDANGFTQEKSISICFNSGSTNQSGTVTIGGSGGGVVNGQTQTAQLTINNGTC